MDKDIQSRSDYSYSDKSDDDIIEILPTIRERLAQLRPSRELLEFYREKINDHDIENQRMNKKLENFKNICQDQLQIQWQIQQREGEISELQKALSNMQGYLFQEREHVLRLYAENDRLKIRELEDRKKINKLLSLSGITETEVSYFIKEPPAIACIQQRQVNSKPHFIDNTIKHPSCKCQFTKKERESIAESEKKYRHDNYTLQLQVDSLQSQLSEQTRLASERQSALEDDISINLQENNMKLKRQNDKLDDNMTKLHKTQELLYDSTKDLLDQRADHQKEEKVWHHEKDKYLIQLDEFKSIQNNASARTDPLHVSIAESYAASHAEEKQFLNQEKEKAEKMSLIYRTQVLKLEDNLAAVREEENFGKKFLKNQSDKTTKRLELVNRRYESLETRRNLEREGFKTEIKMLKKKLTDAHDRLYKVALCEAMDNMGETNRENIDMKILSQVKRTAGRSIGIKDDLNQLKAKVYGLENDLKHL